MDKVTVGGSGREGETHITTALLQHLIYSAIWRTVRIQDGFRALKHKTFSCFSWHLWVIYLCILHKNYRQYQCDMEKTLRKNQLTFRPFSDTYGVHWGWQLCLCRWEQPGWWPHSCSSFQCRCRQAGWAGSSVWSPSSCPGAPPDDVYQTCYIFYHCENSSAIFNALHFFGLTVALTAPSTGSPSLSHSIIDGGLAPRDTQLRL